MAETFHCPSCGAPLDLPASGVTSVRCSFCHNTVIVPETLRPSAGEEPDNRVPPEVEAQIRSYLMSGKKIEAIRVYREHFDSSLTIAKNAVEAMERGEPLRADMPRVAPVEGDMGEVMRLMRAGQEIQAIKLYRQMTGVGLKEAKDAVEAMARGEAILDAGVYQEAVQTVKKTTRASVLIFLVLGLIIPLLIVGALLLFTFNTPRLTGNVPQPPSAPVEAVSQATQAAPLRSPTPAAAVLLLSFGEKGMGPGQFEDARSIGLDAQGNMYLVEYLGGRVLVFDPTGKFITAWSASKAGTPTLSLAAERSGSLFLTQGGDVLRYKGQTGELISKNKYGGSGFINVVAATPDGGALLIASNETIWRLDPQGKQIFSVPLAIKSVTEDNDLNIQGAVDGQGNVYLLGRFSNAVFKYSPQGKYLSRFGSVGDQPGQFRAPEYVAVDGLGRVYVTDFKGVQVFDGSGRYLGLIKVDGAAFGLAVDEQNNLYVVTNKPRVYKFQVNLMP